MLTPNELESFKNQIIDRTIQDMKTKLYLLLGGTILMVAFPVPAQPVITGQPPDQSVSLGAKVFFQVTATGSAPLHYQWHFNNMTLSNAVNLTLVLMNVQPTNAGDYFVVVSNSSGSVTSRVAHLDLDPTFTKITTGPVVTSGGYSCGYSWGCAWGDYDADGYPDLFVCNWGQDNITPHDFLYHNRGDGTFERITSGPLVNANHNALGATWGDYDNDGKLDLFVTSINDDPSGLGYNSLYHNEGNGRFTKVNTGVLVSEHERSHAGIWADFDNDGLLDFFIVNWSYGTNQPALPNVLYHNDGHGTFTPVSFGAKLPGNGDSADVAAADFNNDGWIDFFVPQGIVTSRQNGLLYVNNQDGTFTLRTNGAPFTNTAYSVACAWGDYNNDGFLDLFVTRIFDGHNALYRNNGDGTLSLVNDVAPVLDEGNSAGCAWADYDNDGWLDLFVTNVGEFDPVTVVLMSPGTNCLYHNNGDGSFTKLTSGSLVNDTAYSVAPAWAGYDNDGFLDLFVSNGFLTKSENDFLYHNNGNSNNWITLKLIGTLSNRSAIGAKVRMKATIGGKNFWQMREISGGGGGHGAQGDLRAHFGLGDATNVDLVRIEWPSGIVQTMTNLPAKQFLTVVERQSPGPGSAPQFTHVSRVLAGPTELSVTGDTGFRYLFEASTNLLNWSWLGTRTNLSGTFQFTDLYATNFPKRFYRVSAHENI